MLLQNKLFGEIQGVSEGQCHDCIYIKYALEPVLFEGCSWTKPFNRDDLYTSINLVLSSLYQYITKIQYQVSVNQSMLSSLIQRRMKFHQQTLRAKGKFQVILSRCIHLMNIIITRIIFFSCTFGFILIFIHMTNPVRKCYLKTTISRAIALPDHIFLVWNHDGTDHTQT